MIVGKKNTIHNNKVSLFIKQYLEETLNHIQGVWRMVAWVTCQKTWSTVGGTV